MEQPIPVSASIPGPRPDSDQGLFCNRTLNFRRLQAIGYDMDYTLIHYHVQEWEERAYSYLQEGMVRNGWPVEHLSFDPDLMMRGLVLDLALGNVVKANRFGYVKKAYHGTKPMDFSAQRDAYAREVVDLKNPRWVFANTFFSISEGCMFMQLVDLYDADELGDKAKKMSYGDLYEVVRRALDMAHAEGRLKREIVEDPERFVYRDPDVPLALLDQKRAGKTLILITNSEWAYTAAMMAYTFDPFLPEGMTWRDLFDLSIVNARKPAFFTAQPPAFEVVSDDGLLREHFGPLERGKTYVGGNAALVEASLGVRGHDILYVGDHLFTDVNISKNVHRWRTALVVRELEEDIEADEAFQPIQERLTELMADKMALEQRYSAHRIAAQRARDGYGPQPDEPAETHEEAMQAIRQDLLALDAEIGPLAQQAAVLHNPHWGLLMRTGNDKSLLARHVETYADLYTARVSHFLRATPFAYLRSHRGSLPHDPD